MNFGLIFWYSLFFAGGCCVDGCILVAAASTCIPGARLSVFVLGLSLGHFLGFAFGLFVGPFGGNVLVYLAMAYMLWRFGRMVVGPPESESHSYDVKVGVQFALALLSSWDSILTGAMFSPVLGNATGEKVCVAALSGLLVAAITIVAAKLFRFILLDRLAKSQRARGAVGAIAVVIMFFVIQLR